MLWWKSAKTDSRRTSEKFREHFIGIVLYYFRQEHENFQFKLKIPLYNRFRFGRFYCIAYLTSGKNEMLHKNDQVPLQVIWVSLHDNFLIEYAIYSICIAMYSICYHTVTMGVCRTKSRRCTIFKQMCLCSPLNCIAWLNCELFVSPPLARPF